MSLSPSLPKQIIHRECFFASLTSNSVFGRDASGDRLHASVLTAKESGKKDVGLFIQGILGKYPKQQENAGSCLVTRKNDKYLLQFMLFTLKCPQ